MIQSYRPGNHPWSEEHTRLIVTGIIEQVLADPTPIYRLPGIFGIVDGHGNDRTGKKVEQILRALAVQYGVDPGIIKEVKARRKGRKASTPSTTPRKSPAKRPRATTPDSPSDDH
ncbi:hypothetical protein Q5752_003593 [Cryptotrichosporon argae]